MIRPGPTAARPLRAPARNACLLALAFGLVLQANDPVLVVTSTANPAFEEATSGLTAGLRQIAPVEVIQADQADPLAAVGRLKPRVVVALGSQSLARLAQADVPIIQTMVLEPAAVRSTVGGVTLEVPLSLVLGELKRLCPSIRKVGMIRNPSRPGPSTAELLAQAAQRGFDLRVADCPDPKDLLDAFASLRDKAEAVWCPPDSQLFNATTVQALVMASLRARVPIVAFSEGFARAGAAIAVYPDYRDIGAQTAEAVKHYLSANAAAAPQAPRSVRVALNPKIMRLVGLECPAPDPRKVTVIR